MHGARLDRVAKVIVRRTIGQFTRHGRGVIRDGSAEMFDRLEAAGLTDRPSRFLHWVEDGPGSVCAESD